MKKFKTVLIWTALLTLPWLVAFQGEDPVAFTDVQLAILANFLLPIFAQLYKVYQDKTGKKVPSNVINWLIFAGGVIMAFFWGGADNIIGSLSFPSFSYSDPGQFLTQVWDFADEVFSAGSVIVGRAVIYYGLLKPLVFNRIDAFKTKKMIKG